MSGSIKVVREPSEIQRAMLDLRCDGKSIAVVPTMGALHDGHRALLQEGRRLADILVVTIFVNPTQFAPGEDLDQYPRTFDADRAMCEAEGADYIFFPTNDSMYPDGYLTWVDVDELGKGLCGHSRPTHFRGVTTVVAKLFLITQPDFAVFGWKDAQQQIILRRMARDLNFPVEIVGVDTVREPDGLALSSRNQYLSTADRAEAAVLNEVLREARQRVEMGERDAAGIRDAINRRISATRGEVDYVEIVSLDTLEPVATVKPGHTLIALAVRWGQTRLIDNLRI